jgi:hypothetical protein
MPVNNMPPDSLFIQILHMFKDVLLGMIGGLIAYLLKYKREKEKNSSYIFSWVSLFINVIIGGYVSYLFGTVIDPQWQYKDFVIGSVGVASYPILIWIEANALDVILKKAGIKEYYEKDEK